MLLPKPPNLNFRSHSRESGQPPEPSGRSFRAHARRATRFRALATHTASASQRQVSIENIGLGGACLVAEEGFVVGDLLTLSLTAPSLWDPLVLRAHVAWVGPPGPSPRAGIAFDHQHPSDIFALYELIAALGYD